MLIPPGFTADSIATALGRVVFYRQPQPPDPELPNLVFLHGFGGGSSAYEWSQVYPAFTWSHRVLAVDLLGWGRSEHPAIAYQIEDYLTTLHEFLAQTCPTGATVVASSLTGALVIRAAIAHPEQFQRLILIAPTGLKDFGSDTMNLINTLARTPLLDRLLYQFAIATPEGIRSFLEQRQFARPERITPELVNAYLESAQQPNAEYAALAFVRGDLSFDLASFMAQLTTPTAILWGDRAQFTSVETGKRLADLNPHAVRHFQAIADTGLTPHLEQPAVAIALTQRCLTLLAVENS